MLRWWDGNQWTDNWQLANQPPKKKSSAKTPLLILGGVLIVFLVAMGGCVALIASSSGGSTEKSSADAPRETYVPPNPSEAAASSRAAELDRQRRQQEAQRLTNKASYRAVSSRDWQLVAKNPDAHVGELYVIYGRVVQADAATGSYQIRVNTDGQQVGVYDFDINTVVSAGRASFSELVEDDLVTMWVSVTGSETYDTTMGGSVTAPKVEANIVEVYGSAG
ncbi:DUF2510 domain-containing protein [Gordonia terrae]